MKALILSLAVLVSGAVAAQVPSVITTDQYGHCYLNGTPVECYPTGVMYPSDSGSYIWDPDAEVFFFWYGGYRHYMGRGWEYNRGVPHGSYRGGVRVYGGHSGGFHGGHVGGHHR
jgi:hypothetical protein